LVSYSIYDEEGCEGDVLFAYGFTTGCVAVSGGSSYEVSCGSDGSLEYNSFTNDECTGAGVGATSYPSGCISGGGRSTQQSSCDNDGSDVTIDWNAYLESWLDKVDQSWVIPTFAASSFYASHGEWNNGVRSTSVTIAFDVEVSEEDIEIFVDNVCEDIQDNANLGVCGEATSEECLSNPDSVSVTCTWNVASKKRAQGDAEAIDFAADLSNGVALSSLFALCASLMVLLF
jgi:hypothetical protein